MDTKILTTFVLFSLGGCIYGLMELGSPNQHQSQSLPLPQQQYIRLVRQTSRYGSGTAPREQPIYRPGSGYIFRGSSPNFGSSNGNIKSNSPFSSGKVRPNIGVGSAVGVGGAFSYGPSASGRPLHGPNFSGSVSGHGPNRPHPTSQLQAQQNSIRAGPFGRPEATFQF